MRTIGVAIAVPDPWGETLRQFRTDLGDSRADGIPTHITLIPPCEVPGADLAAIHRHLAGVAEGTDGFTVRLRGTGSFRPVSPVVFVAVAEGGESCGSLASALRTGPLVHQLEFPYHPHVTVAHHLEESTLDRAARELADFDCCFEVSGFSLYSHHEGPGWVPTQEYTLPAVEQG